VFRKAVVGEWLLKLNANYPLGLAEVIPTYASTIKTINKMSSKPVLEVLIGKHSKNDTNLYYIKHDGEYPSKNYIAIGSGKEIANKICQSLNWNKISMKEFAKHAYLAITYMDQYCPWLGVGVAPNDSPQVRYLNYNEEWDQDANPDDIREFREFTDERLEYIRKAFEKLAK